MSGGSTTPDLVDLERGFVEAANQGDLDRVFALCSPRAVWDVGAPRVFKGPAIRSFLDDWLGPYEDFTIASEEIRDLGNGVTFAVLTNHATPRGSSASVVVRYGAVKIWRDGLIERFTTYVDIDQARAAAERLAQERG